MEKISIILFCELLFFKKLFHDTSLMKIIFKVCFLLRSGTQENEKLKREHIREKNFSSGTKEILIFSVAQK
jgi:hypothetical protein